MSGGEDRERSLAERLAVSQIPAATRKAISDQWSVISGLRGAQASGSAITITDHRLLITDPHALTTDNGPPKTPCTRLPDGI